MNYLSGKLNADWMKWKPNVNLMNKTKNGIAANAVN